MIFYTGRNFDLSCCLILLPSYVGWDIMQYESDPLHSYRWIKKCSNPFLKLYSSPVQSTSRPMSWSHHLMNILDTKIFFAHMHISYMGRQAICSKMLSFHRCIYSLMGHIPDISRASATGGHFYSPPNIRQAIIPTIRLATGSFYGLYIRMTLTHPCRTVEFFFSMSFAMNI